MTFIDKFSIFFWVKFNKFDGFCFIFFIGCFCDCPEHLHILLLLFFLFWFLVNFILILQGIL
jgi:hypothetical protein